MKSRICVLFVFDLHDECKFVKKQNDIVIIETCSIGCHLSVYRISCQACRNVFVSGGYKFVRTLSNLVVKVVCLKFWHKPHLWLAGGTGGTSAELGGYNVPPVPIVPTPLSSVHPTKVAAKNTARRHDVLRRRIAARFATQWSVRLDLRPSSRVRRHVVHQRLFANQLSIHNRFGFATSRRPTVCLVRAHPASYVQFTPSRRCKSV